MKFQPIEIVHALIYLALVLVIVIVSIALCLVWE